MGVVLTFEKLDLWVNMLDMHKIVFQERHGMVCLGGSKKAKGHRSGMI